MIWYQNCNFSNFASCETSQFFASNYMNDNGRCLNVNGSQWSKNWKVFWGGEGPKFNKFPLKTCLLMVKYQKLAKSVGGNWGFWFNFDFKNFGTLFEVIGHFCHRWRSQIKANKTKFSGTFDHKSCMINAVHILVCHWKISAIELMTRLFAWKKAG